MRFSAPSKPALALLTGLVGALLAAPTSAAELEYQGPNVCKECHEAEFTIWEASEHGQSFRELHRMDEADKWSEAVGGEKSAKGNPVCTKCHYTMVSKGGRDPRPVASVSCESCHGPSSEFKDFHGDFPEDETPEARQARLAKAATMGMIHSQMSYDIAENCMSCHGLAREDVAPEDLAALLAEGHPLKTDYEYVSYSQGSIRHRHYPPDISVNREMTPPELARAFVIGKAAKLVSAVNAKERASDAAYQEAQQKRIDDATAGLAAVKSVPEAAALLASPTEENARKLVAAIVDKDLTGEVGSMVPDKSTYK